MANGSLSLSNNPGLAIPFMIFLLEGGCLQGIYGTKGSYWLSGSHHVESFTVATMTWLIGWEYLSPWISSFVVIPIS